MGDAGLRMLKFAVVAMGVLIVAGVATLAVVIVRRTVNMTGRPTVASLGDSSVVSPAQATFGDPKPIPLGEPIGTGIAGVAVSGALLAVQLHGGGPDRIVVLEAASGRVVARVGVQ